MGAVHSNFVKNSCDNYSDLKQIAECWECADGGDGSEVEGRDLTAVLINEAP